MNVQTTQTRSHPFSLSVMMFLQYAVWGIWLPYLANYLTADKVRGGLGFSGGQMGWILGLAGSIGALAAPFMAGQIADRFINAERWLGILLIVGGIVKFATGFVTDYTTFLAMSVLYSIFYMPTLALTNSVAFANLKDPEKSFPPVRTWGTIGWIVASNLFPLLWLQTDIHFTWMPFFFEGTEKPEATHLLADCLKFSGAISVLYGLWAFVGLPKTPPSKSAETPLAFAKAFSMLGHPGFLVVTLAALPIAMIHQVYFMRTGPFLESLGYATSKVGPIMSIGQISEIVFLACLGLLLKRIGYKWTIALGALAFAGRYAIFSFGTTETRNMVASAMALHGICYAFFFAGAYVYIDRVCTKDIRHSAQTVFGIIILGLGPVLAGAYNQWLDTFAKAGAGVDWHKLWLVQAGIGLFAALLVALAFRPGLPKEPEAA